MPQAPREGFELGAIDVSAERPSHGLAPDRSTRWLVLGLVGGSLALAGLITLVRARQDDTSDGAGVELRASLGDPLRSSMLALESVRLEAIHVSAVRALGDVTVPKPTPRKTGRTNDGATPAATTPAAGARDGGGTPSKRGASSPAIGDLPPPPPEESAPPKNDAADVPATPPAEPPPAEPPPPVDAPDGEPSADSGATPSGV
ncbi:MAG TPA: hypothetical protein VFG69_15160 [Nannocystaceae bacterium]|nr:hypothetical protein [Nannocystaceae bacterium]